MLGLDQFHEITVVDFEFLPPTGEPPAPVCLVAKQLRSGHTFHLWRDDISRLSDPPYPVGPDDLMVGFYLSAELGCHLSLGWRLPENGLDLYPEFRVLTNGLSLPSGSGLIGAMSYFGLSTIGASAKESMRSLIVGGGPWTEDEQRDILSYCATDVVGLEQLLFKMLPHLDLPRALLRGRFMAAAAKMERTGVPLDIHALALLRLHWTAIQDRLIERIDGDYGVFSGRTFKQERWANWLEANSIPWPRLDSGALDLSDDTFREMARAHPAVAPIRELRYALSQLRLADLAVGADGRNRCLLSAFRSKTGRNQPSNTKFIFGPATWIRGLIRPPAGRGIAYIDWEQQEFGIAAALSGDDNMLAAYRSGDCYLAFAKQAGEVPANGTKKTHGALRAQFKDCSLGTLFGMQEVSLSRRIGKPIQRARELLQLHHSTYRQFWRWSDAVVDYAMLHGRLWTVLGWIIHVDSNTKPLTLRNFPMQANGAEMLRLACCLATERGVSVCAPVHDALLIEAPLAELDEAVRITREAMAAASGLVLGKLTLRTEAQVVRYPDRYMDDRGVKMWTAVFDLIDEIQGHPALEPGHPRNSTRSPSNTRPISSLSPDGGLAR